MSNLDPPVSFFFSVQLSGTNDTASFQEVSGLSMDMAPEEVTEGGENQFKHRVPSAPKFSNLVLKRGLITIDSPLALWCEEALNSAFSAPISPKNLRLDLVDGEGTVLRSWTFVQAYPVKWSVSDLKVETGSILIETLELAYQHFS